jgi:hypothetical protein
VDSVTTFESLLIGICIGFAGTIVVLGLVSWLDNGGNE